MCWCLHSVCVCARVWSCGPGGEAVCPFVYFWTEGSGDRPRVLNPPITCHDHEKALFERFHDNLCLHREDRSLQVHIRCDTPRDSPTGVSAKLYCVGLFLPEPRELSINACEKSLEILSVCTSEQWRGMRVHVEQEESRIFFQGSRSTHGALNVAIPGATHKRFGVLGGLWVQMLFCLFTLDSPVQGVDFPLEFLNPPEMSCR